MSMPFYVSPEQLMKDRADFARKGIGRGRSLIVVQYADGIVFVSENLSQALHKVSEIYDRIAFAAVGRYNEFENLRIAGVRLADMRGYAYDRADVTGRGLANAYAQTLGTIFSSGGEKPYEVELFVAEVGETAEQDSIYRLTYDGQVADEHGFAVMGGSVDKATTYLKEHYHAGASLEDAIRVAVEALGQGETENRTVPAANLEVAALDRTRSQQRKFRRLTAGQLGRILGNGEPGDGAAEGSGEDSGDGGSGPGASSEPGSPGSPTGPDDAATEGPPEDRAPDEPDESDEPPVAPPIS
jgi:proteasome alpha subunit